MKDIETRQYNITLSYESVRLPPVTDMLILGKKYPHGKQGVLQAFKYIAPDEFHLVDVNEEDTVEAVLIDKKILTRIPEEKIVSILKTYVFPNISEYEAIKVDLDIKVICSNIKGDF